MNERPRGQPIERKILAELCRSNAFHEFSHGTVFATGVLNRDLLYLTSLMSWNNPVLFWAGHTEHHKFTCYPADDLEITLDARPALGEFLKFALVNPQGFVRTLRNTVRSAFGRMESEWEQRLVPMENSQLRTKLARFSWFLLAGQGAIVAGSIYYHLWMVLVLIALAPFYARGLQWLCNESQHVGQPGNLSDFRLCSRTLYLNPVVEFQCWHMNYHTDHHIYAAVPCYRLGRLHSVIKADLPPYHQGLQSVWREIMGTMQRREHESTYQFLASVPARRLSVFLDDRTRYRLHATVCGWLSSHDNVSVEVCPWDW